MLALSNSWLSKQIFYFIIYRLPFTHYIIGCLENRIAPFASLAVVDFHRQRIRSLSQDIFLYPGAAADLKFPRPSGLRIIWKFCVSEKLTRVSPFGLRFSVFLFFMLNISVSYKWSWTICYINSEGYSVDRDLHVFVKVRL